MAWQGSKLLLMGSADAIPAAPAQAVVFVEDLPPAAQAAAAAKNWAPGLENLGNTCYMNACLQCLHAVPELRLALAAYSGPAAGPADGAHALTAALRDLFAELRAAGDAVTPARFLGALRALLPTFGATGRDGVPMQQDAEECWTGVLEALRQRLPAAPGQGPLVKQLFGIPQAAVLTAGETGESVAEAGTVFTLKCNITSAVNHVTDGFRLALDASREARSAAAGRDVVFSGTTRLVGLPAVLTVQLMRFDYKSATQAKCKILRAVAFPLLLDVYEFAAPELQAALDPPRARRKAAEDAAVAAKLAGGEAPPAAGGGEHTGLYTLVALLTHKGRYADGGHYVSYVKQADGSWLEFDDERTLPRSEAEILALKGGGDHHMAYLCLYRSELA